mmetsp:Transcript_4079/g.7246  ORF Transcript_4079/g.7246 Transcript_4079/m.7246 type:complete len:170 (-) Transcript_4079:892-1401(-)
MGDLPFNFALASKRDEFVYGAGRPGPLKVGSRDPNAKVTVEEIKEWIDFMKSKDIDHIMCLLTNNELESYDFDVLELLRKHFKSVNQVDARSKDKLNLAICEVKEAVSNKEKVLFHCWGGGGRVPLGIGAWLVKEYGCTPEEATSEIIDFANEQGASRRLEVEKLNAVL